MHRPQYLLEETCIIEGKAYSFAADCKSAEPKKIKRGCVITP